MSDRGAAAALAACLFVLGCGPSATERSALAKQDELQRELNEARQYNEDLKFRLQLAQARSKLLIGLVQGLTVDPDHYTPSPERLAAADASLQSIDQDIEALIATVRTSRQNVAELRAQREALQRELADARHAIEHARATQATVDARIVTLQSILAPMSALVRSGRINVGVSFGRFAIQLPESALFARGQSNLSEDGKSLLDRVTEGLRGAPDRQFRVSSPREPLHKRAAAQRELTLARSVALLDYLRAHQVSAESAVTATLQHEPSTTNDRFYEITLVPRAEELPALPTTEQLLTPAQ